MTATIITSGTLNDLREKTFPSGIEVFNRDTERSHPHCRIRNLSEYKRLLGEGYTARVKEGTSGRVLDAGGGFGVAAIQLAHFSPASRVTVINSTNLLRTLIEGTFETKSSWDTQKLLLGTLLGLNQNIDHLVERTSGMPIFEPNWDSNAVSDLTRLINPLIEAKRLVYEAVFAERRLPSLDERFDVISDLHGPWYYSASRLELAEEYYAHLADGGEAFVVIGCEDNMLTDSGWKKHIHGPKSLVNDVIFEEYLCKQYPSIFSLQRAGDNFQLTTILKMRKDKAIETLGLSERLALISRGFDESEDKFQRDLPRVNYITI